VEAVMVSWTPNSTDQLQKSKRLEADRLFVPRGWGQRCTEQLATGCDVGEHELGYTSRRAAGLSPRLEREVNRPWSGRGAVRHLAGDPARTLRSSGAVHPPALFLNVVPASTTPSTSSSVTRPARSRLRSISAPNSASAGPSPDQPVVRSPPTSTGLDDGTLSNWRRPG
jgi:hypothetical protein